MRKIALRLLLAVLVLGLTDSGLRAFHFQSGSTRVSLDYFGYVTLPPGLSAYLASNDVDAREGCFRSADGELRASWWTRNPTANSTISDWSSSGLTDIKLERGSQVSFEYATNGAGTDRQLFVLSPFLVLIAPVPDQGAIESILQIARSWTRLERRCPGCRPLLAPPPRRETLGGTEFHGCSAPVLKQLPRAVSPSQKVGRFSSEFERFASVFPVQDRVKQQFVIPEGWRVQPVCDGTALAKVVVVRDSGSTPADRESSASGGLRKFLEQIDQIMDVTDRSPEFDYWPPVGADIGWKVHAQFSHAVLDANLSGGSKISLSAANLWFYRPISGRIEALRAPVGTDRRSAVQIAGNWYWIDEAASQGLKVGRTVRGLTAAGPDSAPELSDRPRCPTSVASIDFIPRRRPSVRKP